MSTIILKDLLGEDIRSRGNALKLKEALLLTPSPIVIDMQGIVFVSRSFSDELLSLCEIHAAKLVHAEGEVKTMLEVVSKSRSTHKEHATITSSIIELHDMNSVHDFFSSLR